MTDGGSAFPHQEINLPGDYAPPAAGMTLRDYFAAQLAAGMLAESGSDVHDDLVAKRAYALADALLAERAK